MSVFVFALAALAAYRITRFITVDTFPPMAAVRSWLIKRWSKTPKDAEWAEMVTCPFCVGFWCAGLVLAATRALGYITLPRWKTLALWLPLAGAQALLSAIDARLS